MATPKSIPSVLNTDTDLVTPAQAQNHLFITAILIAGDVYIDEPVFSAVGPVSLTSPIICRSFMAEFVGQVAYFEQ